MSAFVVKYITVFLCQEVVGMHNICKVTEVKNRPFKAYGQCKSAPCRPFKCLSTHIFRRIPAVFILALQSHLHLMYVFLSCGGVVPDSVHVPHSPKLRPHLSIWLRVGWLEVRDEAPLVSYSSWCNREQPGSKLPLSGIIPAHAINEVIVLDYKICIFKT